MNRLYALFATLAAPALLHPRLRSGAAERLMRTKAPRCQLWIQAASAGECRLVPPLVAALPAPLHILATATTTQGRDFLVSCVSQAAAHRITLAVRHQPWDHPALVGRLLDHAAPKAVVLLETELWPGILSACSARRIPVVVASARMTPRSFARYLRLGPWLSSMAPTVAAAVSPADAARFATLFPQTHVEVVPSLKFALALDPEELPPTDLVQMVAATSPVLVLGSIRAEEEEMVRCLITHLRARAPQAGILLFPRHLHRVPAWQSHLTRAGIPFRLRSENRALSPGEVLVADRFGELRAAYAMAHRAFVGGTFVGGGHNFLEPLAQGVLPTIGPHWEHFAWVGKELVDQWVCTATTPQQAAQSLLLPAPPRHAVRAAFAAAVAAKTDGAHRIAHLLTPLLESRIHP